MEQAAGQSIELGSWTITEELVKSYLEAVGDNQELYLDLGLIPPLALCAYALGALLDKLALPAGTIHSIQELEVVGAAGFGQEIYGEAVPERPRRRGGLQFTTVAYTMKDGLGNLIQTGKTTVLTPGLTPEGGE